MEYLCRYSFLKTKLTKQLGQYSILLLIKSLVLFFLQIEHSAIYIEYLREFEGVDTVIEFIPMLWINSSIGIYDRLLYCLIFE